MKLYVARDNSNYELGSRLDDWTVEFGFDRSFLALLEGKDLRIFDTPPLEIGEYTSIEFEKPSVVARVGGEISNKFLNEINAPTKVTILNGLDAFKASHQVLWERKRWDGVTIVCLSTGERFQFKNGVQI